MKERQKQVKLVITSCRQCPHMKKQQSPYTGDSFDMIDVDLVCTKTGKILLASARPWEADKDKLSIPQWCPL